MNHTYRKFTHAVNGINFVWEGDGHNETFLLRIWVFILVSINAALHKLMQDTAPLTKIAAVPSAKFGIATTLGIADPIPQNPGVHTLLTQVQFHHSF